MKRKSTGSRRTASGGATGRSKGGLGNGLRRYPYLAICVENRGNQASLELGKAYKVVKPLANDPPGRVRVVDEEAEDYLYLAQWFVPVDLGPRGKRRVLEVLAGGVGTTT